MNNRILMLSFLILSSSLTFATSETENPRTNGAKENILKEGAITIFVHGTTIPVISRMIGLTDHAHGMYPISNCTSRYRSVGTRLHKADAEQFCIDTFYMFGWSGLLSSKEREKAAHALYQEIATHKGPITLICHSHGSNVVLHLAAIAEKMGNKDFGIDRVILLAPPVQQTTAHLVASPCFKKVISCYSTGDLVQVLDPQGLSTPSISLSSSRTSGHKRSAPFFSKRTFNPSSNLKQVQILLHMDNPGHRSFLQTPFLSRLPAILKLLDEEHEKKINDYILNIPPGKEKPIQVQPIQVGYIRRHKRNRFSSRRA